ncbi:4'-phosphopantetheinyl transferase superfamily protein [Paenibacillus sp. N1-5-1-14]|uniref:4'-phosphopantetheinyl transferase family protein n=1 Tax=Paenibacillus radicibacter TaxID=2972488 RepID=UPI00215916A9|nr:4'-phosphopantetheinyl transferase superfamily protein [Paenibacillus radicibacter]MCR8644583.1 4'-phosphopantetheinyl transferase superfamily protein [Paenibacillus radicibacter]
MRLEAVQLSETIEVDMFQSKLALLPQEQQKRIMRFVRKEDRDRALVGALLTRSTIEELCRIPIQEIELAANAYGKPHLPAYPDFHFNISHSGEWVVGAFDSAPIGVDVEQIQPIDLAIADRFFTKQERDYIVNVAEQKQLERFYDFWTLKESYIKAVGKGLSIPLDSFWMQITESESISLHTEEKSQSWQFRQYPLHADYKLAVCASHANFSDGVRVRAVSQFLETVQP